MVHHARSRWKISGLLTRINLKSTVYQADAKCIPVMEGNVLFNNLLNTFYLQVYGIGHMVKDHSDSKTGNPLLPLHGLLFPINNKGYHISQPLLHQSWSTGRTRNSSMGLSWGIDLTTHHTKSRCSTIELHLANPMMQYSFANRKEGHVLFNDTLNTFYLRLYGIGHMVKDHSDNERGNPLLLFPISSKGSFICIIPQTG